MGVAKVTPRRVHLCKSNCKLFLEKEWSGGVGSTLAEVIMVNVFLNFFDSSTCSRRTLSSS